MEGEAFIISLDFENFKMNAKNNTTNKYVKIVHPVKKKKDPPQKTPQGV